MHDQLSINRGFGGFLNTCGFDHIRQQAGGSPLHGSAPFTPARLISFGENWDVDEPLLWCEGEAVSWAHGAGGHRLRRRIEAPIGGACLRIRDAVEVVGAEPAPVMALYHFNIGWPAVREGTRIWLENNLLAGPIMPPEASPVPSALFRAAGDWGCCRVGGGDGGRAEVGLRWRTDTLPWLQLWRDLRQGSGVLSIEPCSTGRLPDGSNDASPFIEPGGTRLFAMDVTIGGDAW